MVKSLSRHQKPDYPKFIKKAFFKLNQHNQYFSGNSLKIKEIKENSLI
jgi:hypothetical protein